MKVKRNEIHKKLKTKDELNVLIGLDSKLASCTLLVLSLLLLQSSHLGHSYRRVLVKLSTLLVHKSVSFGSLIFTPSFNPISTGGGHIVPPLLRICVFLCKYAYELVEKT